MADETQALVGATLNMHTCCCHSRLHSSARSRASVDSKESFMTALKIFASLSASVEPPMGVWTVKCDMQHSEPVR